MVHIKKVEIYGLKSFGYRNVIVNMEGGMVCITGPNGSGKSNILDAIIFALGENSPKALRVDKLHSLFHDTGTQEKVHKIVRASVSFDNTDRGIPLDSNTVTITREMPPEGESEYYLNGKKVTKSTITDLLEVVRAAPNRLNVVQQGMIMRIAELNSEERRKIIEDIMGLSYFDEKKEEAIKQLEEADRRLEVAMARMGEIRKRIDELEEERNDQLRFQHLERDIKRFRAIKVSNSVKEARQRLEVQKNALQQNTAEAEGLGKELEDIKNQLSVLETEKSKFLQEVDVTSRSKAEVDTRISNTLVRFEQTKATIAAAQQRIKSIGESIPSLMKERDAIRRKVYEYNEKIDSMNLQVKQNEERRNAVASDLDVLNAEITTMINKQSVITEEQMRLEMNLKDSEELRSNLNIEITANNERVKILQEKIDINSKKLTIIFSEQQRLQSLLSRLQKLKEEEEYKAAALEAKVRKLTNSKTRAEQQVESTTLMLEKAGQMAVRYETKVKMTKNARQEDYAIMKLLEKPKEFGIVGILQDLLRWDKQYERAILALASSWMKALVVKDVGKMLKLLEHAREQHLPRLRIIPLDIAMGHSENISVNGAMGRLSSFVVSYKAPNLVDFIFGDTLLAENADAAYELSQQGYKTVTIAGEVFEPKASAVVLDLNSKITNITKTILLGESVEDLKDSLDMLRQLLSKKKDGLREIDAQMKNMHDSIVESRNSLTSIEAQTENVQATLQRYVQSIKDIKSRTVVLEGNLSGIRGRLQEMESKRSEVDAKINEINIKINSIDKQGVSRVIDEASLHKQKVTGILEGIEREIREKYTEIAGQKAELNALLKRVNDINDELTRIKAEAKERSVSIRESARVLESLESALKEFRDREQQIIDTSGNSVGILQEYEGKIKVLADQERRLSKQLANIEKEMALSRKEISDLTASEAKLLADLSGYGYSDLLEGSDVDVAVTELVREYESIRSSINQLADKSYVQIIDGYRGMSARKNQLESERNSVVWFIEDIEKEKKEIFMDAFQKVNKDVRYIFSTMTDSAGSAWMEIDNPDDVFASGISFLAQFPSKPARESTSLSGGEKTIAATTFLLALQSLKPSPFYLFDEVDAHLDALNTERLSKIIMEKSKITQMIVVTLKDAIVAKAQLVHGVYPRNGVSQVIKYRANAPNIPAE
jgi:chromosome segregation protein